MRETPSPTLSASPAFPLAQWLRVGGALIVMAAMSAFLMQGFHAAGDPGRYYLLLAQTGLLAAGGLGLSFGLKENKGGRVFLALGLLSITANAATLGALVYSRMQWFGELATYPSYARWVAPDVASLLLAGGSGLAVAAPVAIFGFLVLSRRSATPLAWLFLIELLLLALPVRVSLPAGLIVMTGVLLPMACLPRLRAANPALGTKEGRLALAAVFAPAGLGLLRDLLYYRPDAALQALLGTTVFLALRIGMGSRGTDGASRRRMALASLPMAAWVGMAVTDLVSPHPILVASLVFSLVFGTMGVDVVRRSPTQAGLVDLTASILLLALGLPALVDGSLPSVLLAMVAGGGVVATRVCFQRRFLRIAGGLASGLAFCHLLLQIARHVDVLNWITLAVLGSTVIVAGSLVERYGTSLRAHAKRLTGQEAD